MLNIAKHQMLEGLRDAKYLFMSTLVVLAFFVNGLVYSELYRLGIDDYQITVQSNLKDMQEQTRVPMYFRSRIGGDLDLPRLQFLAKYEQRMMLPPSPVTFLADGGGRWLPNVLQVNAFGRYEMSREQRENEEMPVLPGLDWSFIVGALMTLTALLISFSTVAGEKQSGTLRQVLSNPLSRLGLFAGKYLGLLSILIAVLAVGTLVNLATIAFLGGPPLSPGVLEALGWALLLSVLCVSAFLLTGMAVSAFTHHPTVALVVLLVIWILAVLVMPGMGRLVAEQLVKVPSQQDVTLAQQKTEEEIWENAPRIAGTWRSRPFDEHIPLRAEVYKKIAYEQQRIRDEALAGKLRQILMVRTISSISPTSLMSDGLQIVSGTGIHGIDLLERNAERYQQQLYRFVVERDETDPTSPHLIYPTRNNYYSDRGTFSLQAVPVNEIPRISDLWTESGLSKERPWPLWQLLGLLGFNLLAGLVAFVALLRYDPR
jgi:ABC-type transport system involved in multi-copper enzyme maturation permease subunit